VQPRRRSRPYSRHPCAVCGSRRAAWRGPCWARPAARGARPTELTPAARTGHGPGEEPLGPCSRCAAVLQPWLRPPPPEARPGGSWAQPSRPCPCTPPVQCPLAEQPQPRSWSALLRPILLFLVLGEFSHGRRGHLHCVARPVAPHVRIPHRRRDARARPSPDRRRPLSRGLAQRRGRRRRVMGPLAVGPSHLVRPAQRRRPRRQQRR
jgi:hypothetical protein